MSIILIHGNALGSISDQITVLKSKYAPDEIREFNSKVHSINTVLIEISTPQLFSSRELIILENFDDKIDSEKIPSDSDREIIFRFNKELTPANKLLQLIKDKNGKIILLSEKDEKRVFRFLDYLVEKDKKALGEFEKLYEEFGTQYILTMIIFQLRKFINPPINLPAFILQKMEKQRKEFDLLKIKEIYKKLLEVDFRIKSGDLEDKVGVTLLVNYMIS